MRGFLRGYVAAIVAMPSESGRKTILLAFGWALAISNWRRSATLLLSKAQLFAENPIRRPLGAQTLDEIDRPNLTLRRTRSDTTRSAPESGRFMET
jgi:hypothetical protein